MAEKSRVTTPRGRHESWCQASAVCGCVPIEFWSIPNLMPHSTVTRVWLTEWAHLGQLCGTRALTSDNLFFFFFCRFVSVVWQDSDRVQSVTQGKLTWYSGRSSMLSSDSWLIDIGERSHPNPMHRRLAVRCSSATSKTGNRFGWSFFFAVWRPCARSQLHMNSIVLVESQGSCALVRIVWLQKFDRRDNMIFTVHLNRLIDENTPLEQSTIETCLQEAYKYQKVTKISCDIWSRFEASWLDCVTMMSEMTIAVIVVSASCHHLTRADSGWSRISWFSRVTLPWLRGGTSVAPWRHKCSHVPVFPPSVWPSSHSNFDLGPSPSDSTEKLYHIRAYDFGVQFSFKDKF